jgi:endonuclease/exonuclease/phosphatase family metal-dependent hydrolase
MSAFYRKGEGCANPSTHEIPLHVISYNIKGLPSILTSSEYQNERYALIGEDLSQRLAAGRGADIVLLQEAFSENVRALIRAARYPHLAQGPDERTFVGIDSGLYILSRHPILKTARRAFGQMNCAKFDCFANKGMQFARIEVPGLPIPLEVFNTHLQAGREDPPARARQVKMLIEFFQEHHSPGSPVIFGGDFNLRPGRNAKLFEELSQGLGLKHAGETCLKLGCAKSADEGWQGIWQNAVDHQFYSDHGAIALEPVHIERTYDKPIQGFKLSDHLAHEVRFRLKVPAPQKPIAQDDLKSPAAMQN